jgi:uncharacterized protein
VKFWDTSAIVPLCVTEPESATVKSILSKDSSVVVWWASRTECISAFMRQSREGSLSMESERLATQVLESLATSWTELLPSAALRATAERLLAVHVLRAADAFQLSAAIQWCQRHTVNKELISFDTRLRDAGHKEGFNVLPARLL